MEKQLVCDISSWRLECNVFIDVVTVISSNTNSFGREIGEQWNTN